ncbi:MBL fold metallo-hydrolase [Archaeoglobus veneficus]|uniref:Beta-lactamase domain protein n=1 Tax=Archaeoglobus veneficus (strain DSM 11195 / SNP6) TaxID=693661 RepID=F2KNX0_ARCVS|nr:MBL fold metallo-hydrolase [Archaeoglobus veneficus]AEA47447.1 beta-lactamase domain protein [Archaeoglobus veneficus SNP6]
MVRIHILADNKVVQLRPKGLLAEWGFSAAVDGRVLFDAGQKTAAYNNAILLGLKPEFDCIVLSHGHYDHTGGLINFLRSKPKLFMHPDAWLRRFHEGVHIGMPWCREEIENLAEVIEHREPVEVSKGIYALGEIPRKHRDVGIGKVLRDGRLTDDSVPDDQSLAIKTERGVVLLLGCCHAGLRNTVEYAEEVCGDEVRFVIGGTHLVALKDAEVVEVAEWLKKKVEFVAPCHCTGFRGEAILASKLGEKFKLIGAGSVIEI